MSSIVKDNLARQARLPTKGLFGWFMKRRLVARNAMLEKNAARLCGIESHHSVLEVGFGPGIGLQHAVQFVKDGPGKVCGVDLSPYMLEQASARVHNSIVESKVELSQGSVCNLPFTDNYFDRVFHCNCFYFWTNMQDALQELYRVMKPGSSMVTTLNIKNLQESKSKGYLKYGDSDHLKYMHALELTGFKDVKIEYLQDDEQSYEAIFACITEKQCRD